MGNEILSVLVNGKFITTDNKIKCTGLDGISYECPITGFTKTGRIKSRVFNAPATAAALELAIKDCGFSII